MGEILSQSEIDALLNALTSGEMTAEEAARDEERTIKPYDFKHPDRFSKDQVRTLNSLHEHFARLFSTSLSAFLRSIVEVKLVSVDQLAYSEFIRSIPNPTCICTVEMQPLNGNALLELSPTLSFAIVDRLMGGSGQEFKRNRELTEIEQTIIEKITLRAFECLKDSWANVVTLKMSLTKMETNPQLFLQLFLPTEMVILITFEITCGDTAGTMSLCIPYVVLEPVAQEIKPGSWFAMNRESVETPHREALERRIEQVTMEVVAELGATTMTVRDLLDLEPGDVVPLGTRQDDPVRVLIDGNVRFMGAPGTYRSHRAVKLTHRFTPEELNA